MRMDVRGTPRVLLCGIPTLFHKGRLWTERRISVRMLRLSVVDCGCVEMGLHNQPALTGRAHPYLGFSSALLQLWGHSQGTDRLNVSLVYGQAIGATFEGISRITIRRMTDKNYGAQISPTTSYNFTSLQTHIGIAILSAFFVLPIL
jgi:hypothetical protein